MSLLTLLKHKKKQLVKSETTVTTITGQRYKETRGKDGRIHQELLKEKYAGFVEDFKPDLQVAEITSYLSIGSQDVACDQDLLLKCNITHILSIGARPQMKFPEFTYKYVDLWDHPNENILKIVPDTNDFVKMVCEKKGRVFIHCNAGYSRAPSIAIAYLIHAYKLTYYQAYDKIRKIRPIQPNVGFVAQLKSYEIEVLQ